MSVASSSSDKQSTAKLTDVAVHSQISVLRRMSEGGVSTESPRQYQIREISTLAEIPDEKETQRILYILEGHKYVAPTPPGDFTSKVWHITKDGLEAVRMLKKNGVIN
jgi:hypothetical protein